MAGAVFVFDVAIIFGALIGVFDEQLYRRSGGHLLARIWVFEDTG